MVATRYHVIDGLGLGCFGLVQLVRAPSRGSLRRAPSPPRPAAPPHGEMPPAMVPFTAMPSTRPSSDCSAVAGLDGISAEGLVGLERATCTPSNRDSIVATLGKVTRVGPGKPFPYGVSQAPGGGLNFSLLAPGSRAAALLVEGFEPVRLVGPRHRTGVAWHVEVQLPVPVTGLRYAWLIDGSAEGTEAPKYVIDPCARCLDSSGAEAWNKRDEKKYSPSAVVPDFWALSAFDWEDVEAPGLELKDLIIYEAHVRGFTRHPDSGVERWHAQAGTFLGFIQKIHHLRRLGVNCVELLPIFEFDETEYPRVHPKTGKHLMNYWGYSTVSYFVPMQRFAARVRKDDKLAAQVCAAAVEFKTLVRELHRHGIEVILDVVFNHTGEGAWGESNWHSLSAVAESHYYLMSKGYHTNYTGCGNTVNANDPTCAEWITECLRYWAVEMRVDGFRFDLAASMCRGSDGKVLKEPPLVSRIANDPYLAHCKFIAEPWDCSCDDGYLVGKFPAGSETPRFAEWNGKFRDTVRRFIKGDHGLKGDFATRFCGSADLYEQNGRGPCHSVNFITAHDGFTLRDLVSYHKNQNSDNAEESGEDNNISWNCGVEGPTKDKKVLDLRTRQMKNFMVALFLSAGTPMMLSGDEYGRSQKGNNNTWCQDAPNWFSWSDCKAEEDGLFRFCRFLIALRRCHPQLFACEDFRRDISWNHDCWEDPYNYISFILTVPKPEAPTSLAAAAISAASGSQASSLPSECGEGDAAAQPFLAVPVAPSDAGGAPFSDAGTSTVGGSSCHGSYGTAVSTAVSSASSRSASLLIGFNAGHEPHPCNLPQGREWYRLIDTHLEAPLDICESDESAQLIKGDSYLMTPYSCIVLKSFEDPAEAYIYRDIEIEGSRNQEAEEDLRRIANRSLQDELLSGSSDCREATREEGELAGLSPPWSRAALVVPEDPYHRAMGA